MPRALKICSTNGCPNTTTSGRCDSCRAAAEQRRGTSTDRGYGHRHRRRFRRGVLQRDPFCTCTDEQHQHHLGRRCITVSTVADHHPLDRRQLVERGLDPDDPQYGRGLCEPCHNAHTAQAQPGGWNAR